MIGAARYFNARFWAARFFPKQGEDPPPVVVPPPMLRQSDGFTAGTVRRAL